MKDNNKFELESLNTIVTRLAKGLGVERGLQEITLVNLWPEIIGPRFKDKTKAVSVTKKGTYDILLVAVASSTISQELFLFKKDILSKIYKTTKSLGFNIRDIMFNNKIWNEVKDKHILPENKQETIHFFIKNPTDSELKDIQIPESILNSMKESVKSQNFSSNELKDRILNTIIKDIKTQIWRKNNGFPCCKECGIPVNYYNPNKEALCPSCKYSK